MKKTFKLLSLVLALVMVFTLVACGEKEKPEQPEEDEGIDMSEVLIWDGTVAEEFPTGSGTKDDPYTIITGAQLARAVKECASKDYHYKLVDNIYLNDVSNNYWFLDKNTPWVTGAPFCGTIDGDGYCIYGLWIDNEARPEDGGLVSQLGKGGFKNLGIRYSYVSAKLYAGAFAGRVIGGMSVFENCFVDDTVYVQYTDRGHNGAGGIMGYASAGGAYEPVLKISNCYSKANVLGLGQTARVNGIIGTSWNCAYTMENCYSYGLPPYRGTNENTASYLIKHGWKTEDVYKNIYNNIRTPIGLESFIKLSNDKMEGEMALGEGFEKVEGTTPKLKAFASFDGKPATEIVDVSLYRYIITEFSGGHGREDSPYVITTAEQLRYVAEGYWENTYFKLGADIHVNQTGNPNWTGNAKIWTQSSSNTFGGHFDGCGKTIYGLYMNSRPEDGADSYGTGLFPKITPTATIKNVNIKNSKISGSGNVGGIVGLVVTETAGPDETAQIIGCTVDSTVELNGYRAGGILGAAGGKVEVKDCSSQAKVTSVVPSNGIIGADIDDPISF